MTTWDPYKKLEKPVVDGTWISSSPSSAVIIDAPTSKPIALPQRTVQRPSWWFETQASIERCVFWLTCWILTVSFVAIGVGLGMSLGWLWDIAYIVFIEGA